MTPFTRIHICTSSRNLYFKPILLESKPEVCNILERIILSCYLFICLFAITKAKVIKDLHGLTFDNKYNLVY